MGRVLKILAAIIALLLLLSAAVYLGLLKPPQVIKDIPFINKMLTANDKNEEVSSPKVTENNLLKLELEDMKTTITRLENENAELQQQLGVVEKERDTIKALNKKLDAQTGQLQQLAGYYSNMKVKQAAAIMAELDDETIIGILSNMGSETAAGIIGQLDPEQAAVLTKKMLQVEGGE